MVSIDFDMIVFREGDSYVAYCPELDLSSCGRDVDGARASLKTAVRLFIQEAARMGTLDQVLQEAGYIPDGGGGYVSPKVVATESASVAVEA
jgi:hypothetical protein